MRWLALHFPSFPLQVATRGAALSGPLAISSGGPRPEVTAANAPALERGVRPGLPITAARALAEDLVVLPRNPAAEREALENLAGWAGCITPETSLVPAAGLVLEIAGSLRFFGGLARIMDAVRTGVASLGYVTVMSAAPTPLAAHWLARAGREQVVGRAEEIEPAITPLSINLLDAPPTLLTSLAAAGALVVGDVLRLPRDGVARRFGQSTLDQIDRALGRLPDPRGFFTPPAHFDSRLELPAEVEDAAALLFAAKRQLAELEGFLRARSAGIRRFELVLAHPAGALTRLDIGLANVSRESARLLDLLRERLARLVLPAPVRGLRLVADEILPLRPANGTLFHHPAAEPEGWHVLVDRLRARLGDEAVHGLAVAADHRPERAWDRGGGLINPPCPPLPKGEVSEALPPRPMWLLETPRPLHVVNGRLWFDAPLTLARGPERIEAGWWDEAMAQRDYYLARDDAGAAYWVFRDATGWHLHGRFA